MIPTKKMDLFLLTGASGVGKSTAAEILFQRESDYLVMESDLLWDERFNTPENLYAPYRELWLTVCANISQIGKPVVLCGCGVPEQFEPREARRYFNKLYYLALVCDPKELERRMRQGRNITDDSWIQSSLDYNQWLLENGEQAGICLINTTEKTPEQAAEQIDQWIQNHMVFL
ncbi:MAG: AAA family ATPase [Massiliimalia sp.]|jgi:gluconate kinase